MDSIGCAVHGYFVNVIGTGLKHTRLTYTRGWRASIIINLINNFGHLILLELAVNRPLASVQILYLSDFKLDVKLVRMRLSLTRLAHTHDMNVHE